MRQHQRGWLRVLANLPLLARGTADRWLVERASGAPAGIGSSAFNTREWRFGWHGDQRRPGGGPGQRDGRRGRRGGAGWKDRRRRDRAGRRRAGHRRDRAGGGPRLHRPACAWAVDPGRPHAGIRRGDNNARSGGGGAAGCVLVPAPGGAGSGPELWRLHQLGFRPHRRHDRLQRGVFAGGVRPRHAGSSLGGERGQRGRGRRGSSIAWRKG